MNKFKILTSTILVLLLSACSENMDSNQEIKTAQLIDSAVSGLPYFTPTQSGITDENGFFSYHDKEDITFVLGEYELTVNAQQITTSAISKNYITPYDLFQKDENAAIRFALFLQTLDSDSDSSNGIQLNDAINLEKNSDFTTEDGVLQALVQAAPEATIVSFSQAKEHMRQSIARIEGKTVISTTKEVPSRFAPPSFPTN